MQPSPRAHFPRTAWGAPRPRGYQFSVLWDGAETQGEEADDDEPNRERPGGA